MRITKTVIILAALVAFGIPNTLSAQVKVELTANSVKKIPTKVTLFQDTAMVASQSFTDMAFVLPNVPFNRLKLEARNYQTYSESRRSSGNSHYHHNNQWCKHEISECSRRLFRTVPYWSGNTGMDTGTHENEWCDFRARAWCATDLY